MSKLFKILSLIFALTLMTSQVFAATTTGASVPITVSVTMPASGTGTLAATIRNRSDNATAASLAFTAGSATLSAPWVASSQYLDVVYSATYNATWGVRIVTDNEDLEADTNNTIDSIAAAYDDTAKTQTNYGGLLNTAEIAKAVASQDPSKRATLAWQVYASTTTSITAPTSTVTTTTGGNYLADKNATATNYTQADTIGGTAEGWRAAWAYIVDRNNSTFKDDILEAASPNPGPVDDLTYPMVVVGASGGGNGSLGQHPSATGSPVRPGDTTGIAVYLAARFANTNWGAAAANPFAYVLPAGTYSASMYIELIHE